MILLNVILARTIRVEYFLTERTDDGDILQMHALNVSSRIDLLTSQVVTLLALETVIRNSKDKVIRIGVGPRGIEEILKYK